jgi:phage-related protein (TIGR01555 family)
MTDKPRVRVPAWSTPDSFQNFAARIGLGTQNLQSAASYGFNPITRNRQMLEWMYGGSWIVGKCVDAVAEDMTRAGVEIHSPQMKPEEVERFHTRLMELAVWRGINHTLRWSRLYGGAIAVMLIEGQKFDKPLRLETVGKDQFKGLVVMDRWMVNPSLTVPIKQMGPDLGEPAFYDVVVGNHPLAGLRIHHSRIVRMDGLPQPYWRKVAENGWGISVVEPLYDRLVAFDSTTNGAAQLVHKAHLRTLKVKNLREMIAAGGKAMEGLAKQVDQIRLYQTLEGLTLLDDTDTFETLSYSFTGLDEVLLQFGQQLSGAIDIPLVRLFGQSPSGLNATGESDIRNYYDGIAARQEERLRRPLSLLFKVVHQSEFGRPVDEGFNFKFVPLWQLTETEKADIAAKTSTAVSGAFDSGIIGRATALKELRQSADVSGVFANIADDEISEAESEPPPTAGEVELGPGGEPVDGDEEDENEELTSGDGERQQPGRAKDAIATFALHGLNLVIETPKGAMRTGPGWTCTMAANYGYIQGTWSAEGEHEEMDCFLGPAPGSRRVWIVDQQDPDTGAFDEHKVMLGYERQADAVSDYIASYSDRGFERIAALTELDIDAFKAWLKEGRLDQPLRAA